MALLAESGSSHRLEEHGIDHELHEHPSTVTAESTARAEGVDPRKFVKTVVVEASDGRRAILALEASDRVDLAKARKALTSSDVHLLGEDEIAAIAPECDPGAWPPVGSLFDMPVLADNEIRDVPETSVQPVNRFSRFQVLSP